MEQEQIIKSYDPLIMKRLLSFLKPYKLHVSFALCTLILATIAELLIPVIMQRTIDRQIIAETIRIELEQAGDLPGLDSGNYRYIPIDRIQNLSRQKREELAPILDQQEWFITSLEPWIDKNGYDTNYDTQFPDPREKILQKLSNLGSISENFIQKMETADGYISFPHNLLDELNPRQRSILRQNNITALSKMAFVYFLLLGTSLFFTFFQIYTTAYTGQEVMKQIRLDLFNHTIHQSLSYLGNTPVGTLVTRITNDVETINELFTSVATSMLRDLSLMVGVMITIFFLNRYLALITLLTLPPVFITTYFFRSRAREAYRRVRLWVSKSNAFLSEHISGMEIVQLFAREKESNKYFNELNNSLLKANLAEMYVFATFRPLVSLFTSVSIGVIVYYGASMVLESILSLGVLIAYINLIHMFYRPVMDLTEQFTILQSAMAGGERIFDLLDRDRRIQDKGTAHPPNLIQGSIEFNKVTFSYKIDEPVIKDLSFNIFPGETVAIVGYTGAGKTTIANLLTRLWDIESGYISLDGMDIRSIPLSKLRQTIQPVQQDVFLFSGTIRDNITLGAKMDDETIMNAAGIVQAEPFIRALPKGLDTELNERGSNLSTGQRQLLSFCRVIAHNPSVIILDEATGSIDTETEMLIQKAIEQLMAGRTSLVIAHRLSTIKNAHRIMTMSNGKLIETGTHQELLAAKGLYYNLYKFQYEKEPTT